MGFAGADSQDSQDVKRENLEEQICDALRPQIVRIVTETLCEAEEDELSPRELHWTSGLRRTCEGCWRGCRSIGGGR